MVLSSQNSKGSILPVGTILQMGKYRIDKFLSSGGFGIAYMATNISFGERVAIKDFFMKDVNQRNDDSTTVSVSNPNKKKDSDGQRTKFIKEARRLRSFHNQHIVHVTDLFEENGTAYYVMDYIDGESLSNKVETQGKLSEKEVLGYLSQILDALEEVHNQKMFHLDLKPSNIMVDKDGQVYLIDFGASKQQKADGGGATANSALTHTPGYAPLEQMSQEYEHFGPWTDLYALGATLYNLLTGQKPPSTSKIADLAEDAFQFPSSVSQEMRNLIFWMMKNRRLDRPQSVAKVKDFLIENKSSGQKSSVNNSNNGGDDDDRTVLNNDVSNNLSEQNDGIIAEGYKHISIAKVLPEDIGDIIYFDTTNANTKPPKTKAQYIRNKIVTAIVVIALLTVLYYLYSVFGWNPWLCGVIGFFTILGGIGNIADQVFEGTDYFIGYNGFAVFKFKEERDNIVNSEEIKFGDFNFLLHEETDVYKDYKYQNTNYKFTMIKDAKIKDKLYEIEGAYNNDKDTLYNFAQNLENAYSQYHYKKVLEQFIKEGFVGFVYFGKSFTFNISLFSNGDIKIGNLLYKFNDIDSLSCSKGYFVLLHHSNADKNKKLEIELSAIGNRLIFLDLLSKTHKKFELKER